VFVNPILVPLVILFVFSAEVLLKHTLCWIQTWAASVGLRVADLEARFKEVRPFLGRFPIHHKHLKIMTASASSLAKIGCSLLSVLVALFVDISPDFVKLNRALSELYYSLLCGRDVEHIKNCIAAYLQASTAIAQYSKSNLNFL